MNVYTVEQTPRGYAIFFKPWYSEKKQYIADHLSKGQATKWAERLNYAYREGIASQY